MSDVEATGVVAGAATGVTTASVTTGTVPIVTKTRENVTKGTVPIVTQKGEGNV